MASVMGFSGFGKKARTFDLDAIFEQTRRTAIERSQQVLEERQKEETGESSHTAKASSSKQRDRAPAPAPRKKEESSSGSGSSDSESDSDSELIGPPVPKQLTVKKIPDTHEITLQHGSKTVSALALDPSGARLVTGGYDFDIRSLQYSITGDVILVVSGNAQAKVLDRDGFPVMECPKGDQYIVDMANT
ncbi:unnamed protein product, partial [Coregonus sp. 'balchen']